MFLLRPSSRGKVFGCHSSLSRPNGCRFARPERIPRRFGCQLAEWQNMARPQTIILKERQKELQSFNKKQTTVKILFLGGAHISVPSRAICLNNRNHPWKWTKLGFIHSGQLRWHRAIVMIKAIISCFPLTFLFIGKSHSIGMMVLVFSRVPQFWHHRSHSLASITPNLRIGSWECERTTFESFF